MRIFLTIVAILLTTISFSQSRDGSHHRTQKINISKLMDNNKAISIIADSTHDITSISYVRSKDIIAIAYKLGEESDSIHMLKYISSAKRVIYETMPLYSNQVRASFIQDKSKLSSGRVILMTYNEPFKTITSFSKARNWSYNSTIASYAGSEIDGYITNDATLKTSVYFSDAKGVYIPADTAHSVIYQMDADELGYSWKTPKVAVKHNTHSVSEPSIAVSKKSKHRNVMIMQGENKLPMVSYNRGEDDMWSHPIEMSRVFRGDMHKLYICKKVAIVLFRTCRRDGSPGEIAIWRGRVENIANEDPQGEIFALTDDSVDNSYMSYDDIRVEMPSRSQVLVLCSTKWESDKPKYLKGCIVKIHRMLNERYTIKKLH